MRDEYVAEARRKIMAERERQKHEKGYTLERDVSVNRKGTLARAAQCYELNGHRNAMEPKLWPWPSCAWKPANLVRSLEKAGALYLAEAERVANANATEDFSTYDAEWSDMRGSHHFREAAAKVHLDNAERVAQTLADLLMAG